MYQIIFYDPKNPQNKAISEGDNITTKQLENEATVSREQGRTEVKIKVGYPVKCPLCGVTTDLNFLPYCQELCKVCAEKNLDTIAIV